MKIDQQGIDAISEHEAVVLHVYLDPVGIPTVGVGHVVLPEDGLSTGDQITKEQSDVLLAHDLKSAEDCIDAAVRVPLTQNQFNALVSFVFNVGCGAFRGSTLLKKLNGSQYAVAADEFLKWVNSKGKRLKGLVKRREAERALFLKE